MRAKPAIAIFFVLSMVLAGCTSSENMKEIESEVSKEILPSTVDLTWTTLTDQITLGETARLSFTLQIEPAIPVSVEPLVISPTFSQVSNLSWTDNSDMYQLQFSPDKAGEYQVKISVREIEFSGSKKTTISLRRLRVFSRLKMHRQ